MVVGLAALAIGTYLYWPSRPPRPLSASEYVQLTNFTDSATAPALSPDGRMVTFIRGEDHFLSTDQIYVKLLPDGESVRLTDDEGPKYNPVFTPDGSRVAYTLVGRSPRGISWDTWTVPVLGGQPSRFLPNASGLVWLDSRRVLFSEVKGTGLHMGIVTATEDRSERREIYFPAHERAMAHYSQPSPNGQWVLLVEMDRTAAWQPCRLVPFDGSSSGRRVGPDGACTSVAWSPDGAWMYFSATVDGASHLWRQPFPDGAPEQITFGPTEEQGVAPAPDGRSLITSLGIRQSSIWLHDADGMRIISSEGYAFAPEFSRDGRRIYYLLRPNRRSSFYQLRVLHLESESTETVLSDLPFRDYELSPDEGEVAYTLREGGESEIWLAPLDRRTPPRLVTRGGDSVSFGSGGELLFRSLDEDANFLTRIGPDGSGRERVSDIPILGMFAVSPDGDWTLAQVPGTGELAAPETVAIPNDGGLPRRICSDACSGRWSADGRFLYLGIVGVDTGRTFVAPVAQGSALPPIPSAGLSQFELTPQQAGVPGAFLIEHDSVFPGPDPSTYVFVETAFRRNLFRIPLR